MRITVPRKILLGELQALVRVSDRQAKVQGVDSVLIRVEGAKLTLAATDCEVALISALAAQDGAETLDGVAVVKSKLLKDAIKACPELVVELRRDHHDLVITSGSVSFNLRALGAEDFPRVQVFEPDHRVALPAGDFTSAFQAVRHAVSPYEHRRFAICGVNLRIAEETIRMEATDGHRLAVATRTFDTALELTVASMTVLIPIKAMAEAASIDMSPADLLEVEVSEHHVAISGGGRRVVACLIETSFPMVQRVLDTPMDASVILPVGRMIAAIQRTTLVAEGDLLELVGKDGRLTVSSANRDLGSSIDSFDLELDQPLRMGINGSYLLAALEAGGGEQVIASYPSKDFTHLALRPESGDAWQFGICPVRL